LAYMLRTIEGRYGIGLFEVRLRHPALILLLGIATIPLVFATFMIPMIIENVQHYQTAIYMCLDNDNPTRDQVEKAARFKLPASAHNIRAEAANPFDCSETYASFDLSPAELDSLVASMAIKPPLTRKWPSGFNFPPAETPLGWNFMRIGSFLGGEFSTDTGYQAILIDTTDPKQYTAFVVWIKRY
jgi:hypothetical protein